MKNKMQKNEKNVSHLETITDKVGEIAVHYGFTVIKPPHVLPEDITKSKQFREFDHYGDAEEKVALTRWYIDTRKDLEAQPLAIHYKKPLHGSLSRKKPSTEVYGFEIMGSNRSTSEALLLRSTLAILEDLGYENLCIDITMDYQKENKKQPGKSHLQFLTYRGTKSVFPGHIMSLYLFVSIW